MNKLVGRTVFYKTTFGINSGKVLRISDNKLIIMQENPRRLVHKNKDEVKMSKNLLTNQNKRCTM